MPLNNAQLKYQQDATRLYQEMYDNTLRKVGVRAPEPTLGMDPDEYRRETLRDIKMQFLRHHPLFKVNMRGLRSDALSVFEPQVLAAAVQEINNPLNVPPGELRKIEEVDQTGKLKIIRYVGRECFTRQLGRPGRRVISFNTSNGPVDANGRFMR
jgi:hypothetical protein